VRRVAQRMCAQIRHAQPIFGQYLRVTPGETWQRVEHDYFSATAVME
jgi:hypothetical protein